MVYTKALLISFLLIVGGTSQTPQGVKIGDIAPDFNLKNVDGKIVSLNTNKNAKGYIIVFTCNTCPYSEMYEDRIIALHNKYSALGYPVIAIQPNNPEVSVGDSYSKMKERANDKEFPFAYLIDTDIQETTAAYGATNTPQVFVLNKETSGFRVGYIGAIDNNSRNPEAATKRYVESAVDALLNGQSIETNNTKAIGCTIK
ncbi:AhpC/TSA family protein [Roseivirga ehrenbergii]|uniref:Redoxin n=1 Tax=Roseivirga ehrenbergii (strain DSM 102268 / JCM 13514 / KCTC 12282 / NCIMB 14502 / KMM 6017) TaxID=279360 RepID=A0A150XS60_ROSEK|nr:thioredoxin family protein [Roseivirga ehrenbergii]KYG81589.1 redoxin [Roseivirga ehrenbergii]TCL10758.1 AhpC/TSA family protein [Roseivirga ehrenbergii]